MPELQWASQPVPDGTPGQAEPAPSPPVAASTAPTAAAPPADDASRAATPPPAHTSVLLPEAAAAGLLRVRADARGVSLAVIAIVVGLFGLQWSKDVLAPLLAGLMLSYALSPLVTRLEKLHLPRALGATLVLLGILGMLTWGVSALSSQVDALVDTAPAVTQRVREISQRLTGKASTLERMKVAADNLTAAAAAALPPASAASATPPASSRRTPAAAAPPARLTATTPGAEHGFDIRGYMLSGTLGAVSFLGKLSIVFLVALFIMASGSSFRRKMVRIAGHTLSQKKVTVETLDEITEQIQRYLLVQLGVSAVVGVCTWLAFLAMGLNNAGAWGLAAGITNLIPYVGAVVLAAGAAIVALVQFGTVEMALAVSAASLLIHAVIGNVLTPWWTGRTNKMSPVVVFIAVVVFGWLWGVWGLLLGVPVVLIIKSICDRVEDLKPIGELLG